MSNIRKILKTLAEKPATPIDQIAPRTEYGLTRSLKGLEKGGYVEVLDSGRGSYARLTTKGRTRFDELALEADEALVTQTWDGKWRIIILDLDEARKSEREALRYLLKKANFACVKNTVWISHLPYEHLFENIKKDLGLTTELMIIVSKELDTDTRLAFLEALKK